MSEEDIEVFFDKAEGTCFIESLSRTRQYLKNTNLLPKLDEVIFAEIELALLGAEKAKSEILKSTAKENIVRPIK